MPTAFARGPILGPVALESNSDRQSAFSSGDWAAAEVCSEGEHSGQIPG
jgi:hypothetical protein